MITSVGEGRRPADGPGRQPRPDHAAYLAHWLNILNADPKVLFRTAAPQRAVDHVHHLATHNDGQEVTK